MKRLSELTINRASEMFKRGVAPYRAAQELKISKATAYRLQKNFTPTTTTPTTTTTRTTTDTLTQALTEDKLIKTMARAILASNIDDTTKVNIVQKLME